MLEGKVGVNCAPFGAGGTSEYLFDKSDFMKENFSVDEFLHKNRNVPSLEQLRDNLGLYLKGLRASMIDLINEDYADFVSLSANLVGLDQSIAKIQRPIDQFRDEIEGIRALIDENATSIRDKLNDKRELREYKRNLQSLKTVYETIKKLEDLLAHKLSSVPAPVHLERAALDLIQMRFNEKFCESLLSEEQKENIVKLEEAVLEKQRILFKDSLKKATSTCSEQLERCLRIYITLDACSIAEKVFRDDFVAPYMSNVISEQCLQNSPQGLAGIYSKILNFISLHMTDLLRLTLYTDKLRGFNFLVNSFWADVDMRLETHMNSIFAPGNSEVFYAKYKCTCDFLSKIEELLATEEAVQYFRQHKQTRSFQARWNLPVYFQICFQEIAGTFESNLDPILREDIQLSRTSLPKGKQEFELLPFDSARKAITRCWAEGVFLPEVFPKFFKLNIQIILRLSRWIEDVTRLAVPGKAENSFAVLKLSKTDLLITLHTDIQRFVAFMPVMQRTVLKNVSKEKLTDVVTNAVCNTYADMQKVLSDHLLSIRQLLVEILISDSKLENIRQVNDLPRLYRKTNRDVPTRSSTYVEQMLRPLKAFAEQQTVRLGKEVVEYVLAQVISKITADYFVAVSDVLTSVQKTEESLRRLRNLKNAAATMTTSTTGTSVGGSVMSDDDKIRLQLKVDVNAWTSELAKLNFTPSSIDKLADLNKIVKDSIKLKD